MSRRKTVHYRHGCPWADGSVQQADTVQETDWSKVTCRHCLKNRGLSDEAIERMYKHRLLVGPRPKGWR